MTWRAFVPAAPLVVACIAFWPLGIWPANDDFLFYRNVQQWTEANRWVFCTLNGRPTVSCACHCAAGWLFAKLAGFSFRTVQCSSLVVCIAGVALLYDLSRRLRASRETATLAAAALATGPFFFGHAFTFMTDAPAVAWMAATLAVQARAFLPQSVVSGAPTLESSKPSLAWSATSSVVALCGIWTRQTNAVALVVPLVVLIAGPRMRGLRVCGATSIGLPVIGLLVAASGFFDTGETDLAYPGIIRTFSSAWLKQAALAAYGGAALCGLFALPMAPLVACRLDRKWLLAALGLTLVCCLPLVLSGGGLCLTNSTGYFLQNAHFGPILLAENFEPGRWGDMDQIVWPLVVWQALTAAALASFAFLIAAILQFAAGLLGTIRCTGSLSPHDAFMSGLVACMLLTSAAFIALLETRFDRYWMTALAPLLGLLAGLHPTAGNRAIRGIAWSLIGLQWTLSATFTHDYLAWNSARWRLFERSALHRKVAPNSIDGGYEINGWRRSADDPETKALPNAVRLWANPSGPRIAMMPTRPLNQNVADRASWTSWARGGVDRQLYLIAPAD